MMRIVLHLLTPLIVLASPEWLTWKQALAKASATNKIIMVEITSANCHYCREMDETTFRDPNVLKALNDDFVLVRYDLAKEEAPAEFRSRGTPTFFFLLPSGKKVMPPIFGAWNSKDFLSILAAAKGRKP